MASAMVPCYHRHRVYCSGHSDRIPIMLYALCNDSMLTLPQVPPGAHAIRELKVYNKSALPFAFAWQLAPRGAGSQPQAPNPNSRTDASSSHEPTSSFSVSPANGVIYPHESLQVTLDFAPGDTQHHEVLAKFMVNPYSHTSATIPSPGSAAAESAAASCDVTGMSAAGSGAEEQWVPALELDLEGQGCSCEVVLDPPAVVVPGQLLPGQLTTVTVQLHNHSTAAAAFSFNGPLSSAAAVQLEGPGSIALAGAAGFEGFPSSTSSKSLRTTELSRSKSHSTIQLNPSHGTVPAFGSLEVQVSFKSNTPGPLQLQLPCWVQHGSPEQLLLLVKADVAAAVAVPRQVDLDFGFMRLGTKAELELVLGNAAESCSAAWEVEQVLKMEYSHGSHGSHSLQQQQQQKLFKQQQGSKQQQQQQQDLQQQQHQVGNGGEEGVVVGEEPGPGLVLGIHCRSGAAPPSGCSTVSITCTADKPGSHHLLLCVKSGGCCSYVRVLVTVVVPDVILSSCR